ncbi:hypothetical protein SELMODRAFT_405666 [Selaginella moellendorffii]|uniref:Uncharacterized protein n=1 Tax=Selaginella moellendorffii TaxID=88036 RepID=D8QZB4_SELML|nr:hypothetical protein SELMODRAFT_405666 [Selaginella moellendorffii]
MAGVELEALLLALGMPRSSAIVRLDESDESRMRSSVVESFSPPALDGSLLLFLRKRVKGRLFHYMRSSRDSRVDKAILTSARSFGLRTVFWAESSFFSREGDGEELIRDARTIARNQEFLDESYSGCQHFQALLQRLPPEEKLPDVTFDPRNRGSGFYTEILGTVIPAANTVAESGGLGKFGLVALYTFQLKELEELLRRKLAEETADDQMRDAPTQDQVQGFSTRV